MTTRKTKKPVDSTPVPAPLQGFQEAASFCDVLEDVCRKLPVEWPEPRIGVSRALRAAGFVGNPTATMTSIEVYRPVTTTAPTATVDTEAEIPEGKAPSPAQLNGYASEIGVDPGNFMTFMMMSQMGGLGGVDMDMSDWFPYETVASKYNPKKRNLHYIVMAQLEKRLGTPIVVINANGSVNAKETVAYIQSLEENDPPSTDGTWRGEDGEDYEIIKVGLDAQGVKDADPLDETRALQKYGIGIGKIDWSDAPLDVRLLCYYAAHKTGELDPNDKNQVGWLRDRIKPGVKRSDLSAQYTKANTMYNENSRMDSQKSLKVQSSSPVANRLNVPNRRVRTGPNRFGGSNSYDAGFPGDRSDDDTDS